MQSVQENNYTVTFENGAQLSLQAKDRFDAVEIAVRCVISMTGLPREKIVKIAYVEEHPLH